MYPEKFICAQINPSTWKIYLRADKFIWAQINIFVLTWNVFRNVFRCGSCPIDPLRRSPISLQQPGKMSPPPSEDPFSSYDFLSDFLPTIDFGEEFRFDDAFNFDDFGEGYGVVATGSSPSYGSYDNDSCSYSVENSVRLSRRRRLRKQRSPNRLYRKESVLLSSWYKYFLRPGLTRDLTHELSTSDRFGEFRSLFRMPLSKVEELTDLLISREYIKVPRSLRFREEFRERSELLVMSALYRLGNGTSFRQCRAMCHISVSEIRLFFFAFLDAMVEMKDEYVFLPRDIAELRRTIKCYEGVGLPGCCGSIDVVHVKWSSCPTGDHNRAKGKAGHPTLAFQCITDYNRRVIGIFGPQFGTRNDKEIVKVDPNVYHIKTGWYKDVSWKYYNDDGTVETERGAYLICDNGYHRWPISISPYANVDSGSIEGYFSTNLESVRKDVECTFGILKKRWRVLNDGLYYRDINICEKIFVTCCCLNNFLLDLMTRTNVRVGRGAPIGCDGIWLDGHTTHYSTDTSDLVLSRKFATRRSLLAKHLHVFRQKGAV